MNIFKNVQIALFKNIFRSFSHLYSYKFNQYPLIINDIIPSIEQISINDKSTNTEEIELKGRNSKMPKRV
jgi:hypothetical protein